MASTIERTTEPVQSPVETWTLDIRDLREEPSAYDFHDEPCHSCNGKGWFRNRPPSDFVFVRCNCCYGFGWVKVPNGYHLTKDTD